jgi:hypothetical protein
MGAQIWRVELGLLGFLRVLPVSFPPLENPPFSQSVASPLFEPFAGLSQIGLYSQVW